MKKKIVFILMILSMFVPFGRVSAETLESVSEGSNSSTTNAVVGTVDAPIYSVEIEWDELKFNWVYDETSKVFGWEPDYSYECLENVELMDEETFNAELYNLYSDSTCSTKVDEGTSYTDYETNYNNSVKYYVRSLYGEVLNKIVITDYSENASIVPSVEWNSASDYDFVVGTFTYLGKADGILITAEEYDEESFRTQLASGYICLDAACDTIETDLDAVFEEGKYYSPNSEEYKILDTAELPNDGRIQGMAGYWYMLHLNLVNDSTKNITAPKSGDVIGSVTISIRSAN